MRHVHLTCKHHPELRWQCKSIAFTPGYGYNGCRNIFFLGNPDNDGRGLECSCPPTDLILAPGETWPDEDK